MASREAMCCSIAVLACRHRSHARTFVSFRLLKYSRYAAQKRPYLCNVATSQRRMCKYIINWRTRKFAFSGRGHRPRGWRVSSRFSAIGAGYDRTALVIFSRFILRRTRRVVLHYYALINNTYAVAVAGVQYVNGIFIALQEHVVHICVRLWRWGR